MQAELIIAAVEGVTKKWARQRKAEERNAQATLRRRQALTRSRGKTIKDAAYEIMETAYMTVSDNNRMPAHARQIMYQARGPIQDLTGERLDDRYFTQVLLPDYLKENSRATRDWDVVFDARGHLREPHTGLNVALGTLQVRKYLAGTAMQQTASRLPGRTLYPTHGPKDRYQAILFIEKEGFFPLFESTHLAQRFDIALMSTKGMSVTASRQLADRLCSEHKIPLLVLHDFDKAGFSILGTLRRNTRRYEFRNRIEVVDLGLRIEDVEEQGLESEDVYLRGQSPAANLRKNGATEAEIEFLCSGRRVELNAFTSARLIAWIEGKLVELGIEKLVPTNETLALAYRDAVRQRYLAERMREIAAEAERIAASSKVPGRLAASIRRRLKVNPAMPWDQAVADIVNE